MIRRLATAALVVLGVIVPPVGASASSIRRVVCAGHTPAAVTRAYYRALTRGSESGQLACFTPAYRRWTTSPNEVPEWNNVLSLHLISLQVFPRAPGGRTWILPGNVPPAHRVVQVVVEYRIRYRQIIDSPNGQGTRFIYVVRQHKSSPWRIAAIGSGP